MVFFQDPDAKWDYAIDWTEALNGAGILTSVWIKPNEIITELPVTDGRKSAVDLSGGIAGNAYKITNRITFMINGVIKKADQTFKLVIINQ